MQKLPHQHRTDILPVRFRALFWFRIALLSIALISNVVLLMGYADLTTGVVLFAGAVLVYTVLTVVVWRCPQCGRYPGNAVVPDYCEKCGARLFGLDRAPVVPVEQSTSSQGTAKSVLPIIIARALFGVLVFALFAIVGLKASDKPEVLWGLTLGTMALGAYLEWKWWRCPHCGAYLKRTLWPGKRCGKCGGSLL